MAFRCGWGTVVGTYCLLFCWWIHVDIVSIYWHLFMIIYTVFIYFHVFLCRLLVDCLNCISVVIPAKHSVHQVKSTFHSLEDNQEGEVQRPGGGHSQSWYASHRSTVRQVGFVQFWDSIPVKKLVKIWAPLLPKLAINDTSLCRKLRLRKND